MNLDDSFVYPPARNRRRRGSTAERHTASRCAGTFTMGIPRLRQAANPLYAGSKANAVQLLVTNMCIDN